MGEPAAQPSFDLDNLPSSAQDDEERALAAKYAPVIRFDAREPFLPLAAGYTIFRADADSPSFPRRIELSPASRRLRWPSNTPSGGTGTSSISTN